MSDRTRILVVDDIEMNRDMLRKVFEGQYTVLQAKRIPIIAMTANAFTEDVTTALAAGMNDHVAKPISYDRLFRMLGKCVRRDKR